MSEVKSYVRVMQDIVHPERTKGVTVHCTESVAKDWVGRVVDGMKTVEMRLNERSERWSK